MENIIEVKSLNKKYGKKQVLKDISFTLKEGRVLGVMGPNGSGKTTLLNILGGLIKEDSGEVKIDGMDISTETKKIVAYLRDKDQLYPWMKISTAIKFYKDFYEDFDEEKCKKLLEFMNVKGDIKIKNLSKGMIEKVTLSLVFARKSKIYILDEPMSGIDVLDRDKIINFIIDYMIEGASLVITTHLIGEIERIIDDVIFIKDGEIIENLEGEELRVKYGVSIEDAYKKVFSGGK